MEYMYKVECSNLVIVDENDVTVFTLWFGDIIISTGDTVTVEDVFGKSLPTPNDNGKLLDLKEAMMLLADEDRVIKFKKNGLFDV